MFVTCWRETENKYVTAQCIIVTLPGKSLIKSAQFSEPKTLGYTGGCRVSFPMAAISLFLSIMLLFAFSCLSSLHLASWITSSL